MLKQKGEGRAKNVHVGVEKNPVPALMVWGRGRQVKTRSVEANHERRKDYRPHYVMCYGVLLFTHSFSSSTAK